MNVLSISSFPVHSLSCARSFLLLARCCFCCWVFTMAQTTTTAENTISAQQWPLSTLLFFLISIRLLGRRRSHHQHHLSPHRPYPCMIYRELCCSVLCSDLLFSYTFKQIINYSFSSSLDLPMFCSSFIAFFSLFSPSWMLVFCPVLFNFDRCSSCIITDLFSNYSTLKSLKMFYIFYFSVGSSSLCVFFSATLLSSSLIHFQQ